MSKRCAHCGDLNPRRSQNLPGSWADYLEDERGVTSVGTLVMPLCRECYSDATELSEEVDDDVAAFLDDVDGDALVDEVAG